MKIDVKNINRSQIFFDENLFKPFYTNLNSISHLSLARYLAPAVGANDCLLNIVEAIAGLTEALFKGLLNIFGSLVSDNFNAKRGILQIGGGLFITIFSIPITSIRAAKITLKFLYNPQTCSSYEVQRINKLLSLTRPSCKYNSSNNMLKLNSSQVNAFK